MNETNETDSANKQPAIATDLPAKWEVLQGACQRREYVGVKFWNPITDPALTSLGGGVVSILSGIALELSTTHVHVVTPVTLVGEEKTREQPITIPRKLVLDLVFYGQNPASDEELQKLAD